MMTRPIPPELPPSGAFQPDQAGLGAWARRCFVEPGHPLTNPDHAHLRDATIGWLWTNFDASDRGRPIAGEAMLPRVGNRWSQTRAAYQLAQWFGDVPDFVITISANAAATMPDATFCALIEHELYHCGQAIDPFGLPRFDRDGRPVFAMRGHDVEQFVGVARRYGAGPAGLTEIVEAALAGPAVQDGAVDTACGTCRRAAA